MVGHVAKGFIGHPAVITVIDYPASGGIGTPTRIDPSWPPQIAISPFVVDPLPSTVFLKHIGLVMQGCGKVGGGGSASFQPFGPNAVPVGIPVIPGSIHGTAAQSGLPTVGNQGGVALAHFELGAALCMDKINHTANGNHFKRFIANIEVKHGITQRDHISIRCGDLDHAVHAAIVEPGQSRGHIHGGGVLVQGDQLDLGVLAHPYPGAVWQNEFGLGVVIGIECILQAKRRVLDGQHPVPLLLDISEHLAFDMTDATNQNRFGLSGANRSRRLGQDDEQERNKQAHGMVEHHRLHGRVPEKAGLNGIGLLRRYCILPGPDYQRAIQE